MVILLNLVRYTLGLPFLLFLTLILIILGSLLSVTEAGLAKCCFEGIIYIWKPI